MPAKKAAQPRSTDLTKFCEELAIGRHDDDLPTLLEAFGARVVAKSARVRWRFTVTLDDLGTLVVDEDNLTLLEMETAERLAGCTWLTLDPRGSAHKATAILTAAIMHRHDLDESDARKALSGLSTMHLLGDAFTEYLSDADPFPSAG